MAIPEGSVSDAALRQETTGTPTICRDVQAAKKREDWDTHYLVPYAWRNSERSGSLRIIGFVINLVVYLLRSTTLPIAGLDCTTRCRAIADWLGETSSYINSAACFEDAEKGWLTTLPN